MIQIPSSLATDAAFELRFDSIPNRGECLSFPCDAVGWVDLDELTERARSNYLFAHTLIGRDFEVSVIRATRPRRRTAA